ASAGVGVGTGGAAATAVGTEVATAVGRATATAGAAVVRGTRVGVGRTGTSCGAAALRSASTAAADVCQRYASSHGPSMSATPDSRISPPAPIISVLRRTAYFRYARRRSRQRRATPPPTTPAPAANTRKPRDTGIPPPRGA